MIQFSRNTFSLCVADVFDIGIARVNLEYLSVITGRNWFLFAALGSGPRLFMAAKSSGFAAG